MRLSKGGFFAILSWVLSLSCITGVAQALDIRQRADLSPRLQDLDWVYPAFRPELVGEPRDPPFKVWNNNPRSTVYLSGAIEPGDADKVARFLEALNAHSIDFVLNSPGGHFIEALRIGTMLKPDPTASDPPDWNFVVLREHQCLSACALILAMGGGMIERGAKVGFHMGILPDDLADSTAQVRDVMNLTYDIVFEYTKLIEDGTQSPLLLREALRHRTSDSFFYLYGGMRSWALSFAPVGSGLSARAISQVGLDIGTTERLCQALGYARYDAMSVDSQRMIDFAGDFIPTMPDAAMLMRDVFERLSSDYVVKPLSGYTCVVSRNGAGSIGIQIYEEFLPGLQGIYPDCHNGADTGRYLGWCSANPGLTDAVTVPLLADALGCSDGGLLRGRAYDQANYVPNWLDPLGARMGTAKRDVNIRATPGLDTQPIDTLSAQAEIRIEDCAITDDSQGVWFQVSNGSVAGWVSARFILEETILPLPITN